MKISFTENPTLINSDIDYDAEYSTNYIMDDYILRILHCYVGVGMSDKYKKESFIEIYQGEKNITKYIAPNKGINEFPILATIENLRKFLDV